MAKYWTWQMCPCHEPLVAQISICSNTSRESKSRFCLFVYLFTKRLYAKDRGITIEIETRFQMLL